MEGLWRKQTTCICHNWRSRAEEGGRDWGVIYTILEVEKDHMTVAGSIHCFLMLLVRLVRQLTQLKSTYLNGYGIGCIEVCTPSPFWRHNRHHRAFPSCSASESTGAPTIMSTPVILMVASMVTSRVTLLIMVFLVFLVFDTTVQVATVTRGLWFRLLLPPAVHHVLDGTDIYANVKFPITGVRACRWYDDVWNIQCLTKGFQCLVSFNWLVCSKGNKLFKNAGNSGNIVQQV